MNFKIFGNITCKKTIEQMVSAMSQPFVKEGALMPDAHAGYALPIGGVVMTEPTYIVPAWVGYDIGCGMTQAKLSIKAPSTEELVKIRELIISKIPLGNSKHSNTSKYTNSSLFTELGKKVAETRGAGQLATLGGGNHFIELGVGEDELVHVCIHSGSRGVGHAIGTHYMKVAAELAGVTSGNVEYHYPLRKGTKEFNDYRQDMTACLHWALANRAMMLKLVLDSIREVVGDCELIVNSIFSNHHNMAEFTEEGIIHRKGATPAKIGDIGTIPGNMKDGYFIVKGLGNLGSLNSASHGAGRVLSRGEAKSKIDFDHFVYQMSGVVTNISKSSVDEAPGAYKCIFEVMESQKDCVEILEHVVPILNIKG